MASLARVGRARGCVGFTVNGYGLYGAVVSGGSGFAGVLDGRVYITGDLQVRDRNRPSYPHRGWITYPSGVLHGEPGRAGSEDFGTAELKGGQASVALDPEFDAVVKGDNYLCS